MEIFRGNETKNLIIARKSIHKRSTKSIVLPNFDLKLARLFVLRIFVFFVSVFLGIGFPKAMPDLPPPYRSIFCLFSQHRQIFSEIVLSKKFVIKSILMWFKSNNLNAESLGCLLNNSLSTSSRQMNFHDAWRAARNSSDDSPMSESTS